MFVCTFLVYGRFLDFIWLNPIAITWLGELIILSEIEIADYIDSLRNISKVIHWIYEHIESIMPAIVRFNIK